MHGTGAVSQPKLPDRAAYYVGADVGPRRSLRGLQKAPPAPRLQKTSPQGPDIEEPRVGEARPLYQKTASLRSPFRPTHVLAITCVVAALSAPGPRRRPLGQIPHGPWRFIPSESFVFVSRSRGMGRAGARVGERAERAAECPERDDLGSKRSKSSPK